MSDTYVSHSPSDLTAIADKIRRQYPGVLIFALEGDLGSGKTTFVKAFCEVLGIKENISSPTFTIVHEYGPGPDVYHFDLYRIKDVAELQQIGFEEYLEKGAWVFIEWPALAKPFLTHFLELQFDVLGPQERRISISVSSD